MVGLVCGLVEKSVHLVVAGGSGSGAMDFGGDVDVRKSART